MADNITEDYVSFETAKLLKEKGFNRCPLFPCYREDNGKFIDIPTTLDTINYCFIPAPTIQMAIKWLFEKKNCIVIPVPRMFDSNGVCDEWGFCLWVDDNLEVDGSEDTYNTREEAENAGIEYCLENIIL